MAWLFQLEAVCRSEDDAEQFRNHFVELTCSLPDGSYRVNLRDTDVYTDSEGHARCCISFESSIREAEWRILVGLLYEHLRSAPPFAAVACGLECSDYSIYDRDGQLANIEGLVVSEEMYRNAGSPTLFRPFKDGYFWVPLTQEMKGLL